MNEAYAQGFIQKCAEAGVDPEQLVKMAARGDQAYNLLRILGVEERTGPVTRKLIQTLQDAVEQQWIRPMRPAPSASDMSDLAKTLWAMKKRTAMLPPSSYESYLNRTLGLPNKLVRREIGRR